MSLLNGTLVFYCRTERTKLLSFNVDIRKCSVVDMGKRIVGCAFLTGVNCGVKTVVQDNNKNTTYILGEDSRVSTLDRRQHSHLRTVYSSNLDSTYLGG